MDTKACEQCGEAPATQHTFRYGRSAPVVDPPEQPVYHATAYLSGTGRGMQFQLGGVEGVSLCNRCLRRARARHAGRALLGWGRMPLIAAGYAVLVIGVVAWAAVGSWTQAAVWLGAGLVVTAVAYAGAYLVLEDEDFAQHTAIDLHAQRLRDQGWDDFWTDQEFTQLRAPH